MKNYMMCLSEICVLINKYGQLEVDEMLCCMDSHCDAGKDVSTLYDAYGYELVHSVYYNEIISVQMAESLGNDDVDTSNVIYVDFQAKRKVS